MLKHIALALLTSLLLYFSSLGHHLHFVAAIAFVPLLLVESRLPKSWQGDLQWIAFGFMALGTWVLTLLLFSGGDGEIDRTGMLALYTLLLTAVLVLFRFVKARLGSQRGYISLPFLWISMEVLLLYWQQDFPRISHYNGFAYTLGIWVLNILLAGVIHAFLLGKRTLAFRLWAGLGLAIAIALGLYFSELSLSGLLPDLLIARLSYFMAGFLLLYALVRGYLQKQNTQV